MTAPSITVLAFCLGGALAAAELPKAPPAPRPDDRFKADILIIVAHPDDETAVTGYLAKAIFDEHRRGAGIFGTRGDGGGDALGNAQSAPPGAGRGIEARPPPAYFPRLNHSFLNRPRTPPHTLPPSPP